MKLAAADRRRAEAFLSGQARPLERALHAYRWDGASAEYALAALTGFQNEDGGFGRGLEPDFRLPASSPLATSVAFQLLRELRAPAGHPLVRGAVGYLLATFDVARGGWPAVPPEVNDHPHAPWWSWKPTSSAGFVVNPGVELVAHLWHYCEQVPLRFLRSVTDAVETVFSAVPAEPEMHDLLCWLWLARTPAVPAELRDEVREWSRAAALTITAREVAGWTGYGLKPTTVAPEAERPWSEDLAVPLRAQLDYEIARQGDDGAWAPNWNWSGSDSESWTQAEREWKGLLTLRLLLALRAYGRLE
jgi:hypothetical protein